MENENSLLCSQEPVVVSHCGLDITISTASKSVIKIPFQPTLLVNPLTPNDL
jgi:hypothetical protein